MAVALIQNQMLLPDTVLDETEFVIYLFVFA